VEHYRNFWEASLDRLDQYLKEVQATETGGADPGHIPTNHTRK